MIGAFPQQKNKKESQAEVESGYSARLPDGVRHPMGDESCYFVPINSTSLESVRLSESEVRVVCGRVCLVFANNQVILMRVKVRLHAQYRN